MQYKEYKSFIAVLFIVLPLSYSNSIHAIENRLIEFSLYSVDQSTHFNFSSNNYETKYQQLGLNWYESFSSYIHAGLEMGYINVTQTENTLSSAQYTSGEYAGLLLRFLPVEKNFISLIVNLNYRYHQTKGYSTNQQSEFIWSESALSNELQFHMTENSSVFVAAEYQILDGRQHDSGNINQTRSFNNLNQEGYRAGIDFSFRRSGNIRIEWQTGFRNGLQLHFTHKI